MDPKEKLKELESQIIQKSLKKLEDMQEKHSCKLFEKKCELNHLAEMVKLAHQIRSLM